MGKCEWKNLEIDNLPPDILTGDYEFEYDSDFWTKSTEDVLEILRKIQLPSFYYRYRKQEEEPLIVKSGGTWVAYWKSVDYLCTNPDHFKLILKENWQDDIEINSTDYWKPFSEIELTDEIAKLRPMVIDCESIEKLYAIENNIAITDQYKDPVKDYRLANPHELQEAPGC